MKPQAAKSDPEGRSLLSPARTRARSEWSCDWIPSLAEPYLRGYTPQFENGKALLGYRLMAQHSAPVPRSRRKTRQAAAEVPAAGFFIGYLLESRGLPFLKAAPPQFLVFCFVEPVGGRFHRRLVSQADSLMRRTAEYIRWLTHRPPHFELFTAEHAALVRHTPMQQWPAGRTEHYARNFVIETLAWLVRSALVRRLPGEIAASFQPASKNRVASE